MKGVGGQSRRMGVGGGDEDGIVLLLRDGRLIRVGPLRGKERVRHVTISAKRANVLDIMFA